MTQELSSKKSYPVTNSFVKATNLAFLAKKRQWWPSPLKHLAAKKILKLLILILVIVIVLFLSRNWLKNLISSRQAEQEVGQIKGQTINLDKKFEFPGLDDSGKKKGKIKLKISQVEKTDQVIVQDKTYTAKNNKAFLIINLELKNESTDRLNIFPGDLVRLIVDSQEEKKFAPDLHNNYVQVAPISTKIDRLGFVIEENAQSFKIQVGELEGKKEVIEVNF